MELHGLIKTKKKHSRDMRKHLYLDYFNYKRTK